MRTATADDAEALGPVHVQCWREAYSHLLSPGFFDTRTPDQVSAWWVRQLESLPEDQVVNVAEVGGALVGFAGSGPSRDEKPARPLQLYFINVLAAHHGSGIGQALLDGTIGDAPATLWMAKDNPRALSFYRRNGVTPDGATRTESSWENLEEIRLVR